MALRIFTASRRILLSWQHLESLVVAGRLSCSMARGILVPQPGFKTVYLALQAGFFFFKRIYLFLLKDNCFTICVLVSAIHPHESAIGIHMSSPSCNSLPLPSPIPPLQVVTERKFEFPESCSKFPPLSTLHMVVFVLPCYSPSPTVSTSLISVCISTAALHIGSSAPSF